MNDHIRFTNDISYHRQNNNLSQKNLAELIGTSRHNLSRIENGHFLPKKYLLERIAKQLNVLMSQLYQSYLLDVILKNEKQ